jgi:type II secretion system protein D
VPAIVQVYSLAGASPTGVAAKLRELFAGQGELDISVDRTAAQIAVLAPPATQHMVASWLASNGLLAGGVMPAAAQVPTRPAPPQPQRIVSQVWPLKHLSWREFESRLTSTWGRELQASHDPVGDMATFRFPASAAGTTTLVVDRRNGQATIAAPASSLPAWMRLMQFLDAPAGDVDEHTAIVPIPKADPEAVQRAVLLLTQAPAPSGQAARRRQHVGQFVGMLFQPPGPEGPAGGAGPLGGVQLAQATQPAQGAQPVQPAPPPQPAPPVAEQVQAIPLGTTPPGSVEALARINNVQIEVLDDVVVIKGRREDVERVQQIIEQIERQSLEFRPQVEIYHLKHVDSQALSDMLAQVYTAAFARQGQVTIVPLQRPNALVLIGRKEAIPPVIEVIAKLDQPAPADGELKIFRLQHMSAIDAERTIRTFFVTRPPTDTTLRTGLGTRALVVAEFRTNSLIVQAAPRDMLEIVRLIESLDVPDSGSTNEIRVFKLRNAIADTLAPILQEAVTGTTAGTTAQAQTQAAGQQTPARAIPPAINLQFLQIGPEGERLIRSGALANVRITADARSNALIVIGPAASMELMAALIKQLDELPATEAQIKVFTIRNGDATALAEMLQNLFGTAAAGQAAGQAAPTFAGESAIVPLRFSVDQRTNSIIASGNAGDLNVIYHILTRLDEGDVRQRETRVYRLRNAPAADVATALSSLLQQQLQLIQTAPELVTPVEQLERQVIVVPEAVTNSLIVSATPRYMQEITRIVEQLDRRPPMVVIQVVIAEVTLSDDEQFGVEWGLQDALMFDRSSSATGSRFNFNPSAGSTLPNDATAASLATRNNVATQGLANFALGRTDPTLGFGGLVLTASSESVNVLLRALEQSSRAQVISRPQVQTLDNQIAFVQVGAQVPRIQGSTITQFGVSNQVLDTQVGIILQVTPRTSPDGLIVMQVNATKSAVGPESTGIPVAVDQNGNVIRSPQILLTTAQTTVSARSGQTIVIGGLITKDLAETTRRIPYLADIPVLGRLFRFDSVSQQRTELLIIMTPYIVQTDEQIDWINARESERMSWCVADVVNIHGPVPVNSHSIFGDYGPPIIYPDGQPGSPTQQPVPTPASPEGYPPPSPAPAPDAPPSSTPGRAPGAAPLPGYGDGASPSLIIPQPPSLMPPATSSGSGRPTPSAVEPAVPPAGTTLSRSAWPAPPAAGSLPTANAQPATTTVWSPPTTSPQAIANQDFPKNKGGYPTALPPGLPPAMPVAAGGGVPAVQPAGGTWLPPPGTMGVPPPGNPSGVAPAGYAQPVWR